jgi:hypothetical protein
MRCEGESCPRKERGGRTTETSKCGGIGRDRADSCSTVDRREVRSTLKGENKEEGRREKLLDSGSIDVLLDEQDSEISLTYKVGYV